MWPLIFLNILFNFIHPSIKCSWTQEEKLKTAATAMGSDLKVQSFGGAEKTTETMVDMDFVERL
jgi:hypothetical protein